MAGHAGRAWHKAERLFDEAVQAQEAVEQIKATLGWFDASGHLYNRQRAQGQLDEASGKLQGESWSKAKRMLKDARTLSHFDRLHEQLGSAVPEPMLPEALTHLWVNISLTHMSKSGSGTPPPHCAGRLIGQDAPATLDAGSASVGQVCIACTNMAVSR